MPWFDTQPPDACTVSSVAGWSARGPAWPKGEMRTTAPVGARPMASSPPGPRSSTTMSAATGASSNVLPASR